MTFLSQCRFQTRWRRCLRLSARHQINIPVRIVGAAFTHFNQTSSPWSQRAVGGSLMYSTTSVNHEMRKLEKYQLYQRISQSKPPLLQLGNVSESRWSSASSRHNSRKKPKGFLDVKKFQSVEEASNIAFNNLEELNPRSLSSFWTRVSQLMDPRNQKSTHAKQKMTESQGNQLMQQLNSIFARTIGGIKGFPPRDLAQTALGFAKIMKTIDSRGRCRCREHLNEFFMRFLLVSNHNKNKSFSNPLQMHLCLFF